MSLSILNKPLSCLASGDVQGLDSMLCDNYHHPLSSTVTTSSVARRTPSMMGFISNSPCFLLLLYSTDILTSLKAVSYQIPMFEWGKIFCVPRSSAGTGSRFRVARIWWHQIHTIVTQFSFTQTAILTNPTIKNCYLPVLLYKLILWPFCSQISLLWLLRPMALPT